MRKRWKIGLGVAAALLIGLAVAWRHDLLHFALETSASAASGYSVRIAKQQIGSDRAALFGVNVSRDGVPVFAAGRIDVRYSLRDLLPGSTRRFGLVAIEIAHAKLTVMRFRDGTYNFVGPSPAVGLPVPPQPEHVPSVPIRFSLRMHDASLELLEPTAYDPSAKAIAIQGFGIDATIDSARRTHYSARGAFVVKARPQPFTIVGTIDAIRGYATHRARAARFPLRALANYFAYTPIVRITKGRARNFDARLYSLDVRPNVAPSYHTNLQLDIDGGALSLAALDAPLEDVRGRLQLVDDAVFLRHMHASLSGIPLHLAGGIFDLGGDLTGRPQLRLGVYGAGDLARLRHAFTFTRREPISGAVRLGVLVEGPLDNPAIVARASAARAIYRRLPFDSLDAEVVYRDKVVSLLPLHAYYGGTEVGIRGTMTIGKHLQSKLALHVVGSADRLPYLDEMLGREPMLVDAAATGTDTNFTVNGAAASARGVGRVAALIALGPNGTAAIEPFWLHTERGDFDGGYLLDRPHGTSAFWALAGNLHMRAPGYKAFPGLTLPAIPNINGRIAAVAIAGGGSGKDVALAGVVSGDGADIGGVKFDRLAASFGGTLTNAQIGLLHAAGPWGEFDGNGAFSSQVFVAGGQYRGTLEGLQPYLGKAIPGHGPVSGHAAVAVAGNRIVVQSANLKMPGATLRGIPVSEASLTIGVEGDRLRVYSARARAAGGDVVAAGTFSLASAPKRRAGALSLVASRLDAVRLRGIGLPLDSGRLWASGNLSAGAPLPSFDGGVTLAHASMQHFAVAGNGDIVLAGQTVDLRRTIGSLGTTYARIDGTLGALAGGGPTYALDAVVPAAPVAGALRSLHFPTYSTDGSFNANLRVGGRGGAPTVQGRVNVPAGIVNGLPFVDGRAVLSADPHGVSAREGSVRVGTTAMRFSAAVRSHQTVVAVSAPRARLEDFDNFFDTGDTLDGRGSLRLFGALDGDSLKTSANIDVQSFRYRNLPIGDTEATWSSSRNSVAGTLAVGGKEGKLRAGGSIDLAHAPDLPAAFLRSRYDLTASVSDLDLSLWVPALGFAGLPVSGRAQGNATIRGRFPQMNLRGNAAIANGTIGPLVLQRADASVHSVGSRIAVDSAELVTPWLSATATGSLGMRPLDPLDLQVHASTDDLPKLVYQVAQLKIPVTGAFESTLQIGGTYKAPTYVAGLDATDVHAYGIAIASLFGEVRLHGKTLVLSNAGATFAKGEATLAGSLPLELAPLQIGPPNQPVNFDVDVVGLDPAVFDGVLGNNTKLGGTINGHLGLSGTIREPRIVGHASLEKGSYVSDVERTPVTGVSARMTFNRTSASIDRVAAMLGSGSVRGSGRIEFANGFESAAGYSFTAQALAKGAQLNFPAYGNGTLDADLALNKTPQSDARLSGKVTLSNATLPFSAFVQAAQRPPGSPAFPLPPMAFDLTASAGHAVRVRGSGYGAGLDIGVTGGVHLGGTMVAPQLSGTIASSGGTLTYFDRAFRVSEGSVSFDPSDGVLPTIHAVATSSVVNPDPDRARNPYGTAEITIEVDGPIEGLKIAFTTNPPGYTRDQIISMIAPFGGFINGIAFNNQSPYQVQSPGGITPLGTLSPLPEGAYQTHNGAITVGQEAFNILNAQFTAGLLAPLESALGQGLGLSSVNLTLGYYGNVGVSATRLLGKSVSAIYATTFGLPQIQSFGVKFDPSAYTSATLNFFYQTGPTKLFEQPVSVLGSSNQLLLSQPLLGNSGFSLSLQRYLY
ncbi:MAG TPA: translocation/assembly module TamB domain-containing protein [Candidatus Tumulicola sp.]